MTPKELAEEVWRMLPGDCREKMEGIEKVFKESVEADINESQRDLLIDFASSLGYKGKRMLTDEGARLAVHNYLRNLFKNRK